MAGLSRKLRRLPLQVIHGDCTIFQGVKDARTCTALTIKEDHMVGTLAANLVHLSGFIARHIPILNDSDLLV